MWGIFSRKSFLSVVFLVACAMQTQAQISSDYPDAKSQRVVADLIAPWGIGFLPGGAFLVTERDGALLHFDRQGRRSQVRGLPAVHVEGQGGLLDVVPARDFDHSREVFFTYATAGRGGAKTALAVARLGESGQHLTDWRVIYEMPQATRGGRHFGSRVVEARDGSLYLTIGDRGARNLAQDIRSAAGSVVRVNRDGSIPRDNPDFGPQAVPGLWSIGHRNPQGAAMDARGRIWVVEHGARGGDEVNLLKKGGNFGWPVISYGTHYSGARIGEGTAKPGLEQPALFWDPSIAPSGMMIYDGDMFPKWRGDIFVGSLKFDYISRISRVGGRWVEVEQLRSPHTERVRDIRQAPDGSIWFLSVGNDTAYRLAR